MAVSDSNLDNESGTRYNENKNENKGSDKDGQDTELLERGEISASRGSENNIREFGKNTRTLAKYLGLSDKELRRNNIRAGESGWLEDYQGNAGFGGYAEKQRVRGLFQSICRKLSGTKLKFIDTAGRKLPRTVLNNFSETVFKNEDGTILSLWHWTPEEFTEFKYGDIGFHAGTLNATHAIRFDKAEKGKKGIF